MEMHGMPETLLANLDVVLVISALEPELVGR